MVNLIINIISLICSATFSGIYIRSWSKIWIIPVSFLGCYFTCFILFALSVILVTAFISKNKSYNKYNKFYHYYFAGVLEYISFCSNVKVKISGKEKLPKNSKFLIVANHKSRFDPMITFYALKKYPIAYISKPSNFKVPFGGKLMQRNGFIPIDREDNRNALISINTAISNIFDNQFCIGVYPEGTRNKTDETLLTFKPGCFKIATRAQVPIVIATTYGTEQIAKNAPWKRTTVYLDILDVINPNDFENTQELSNYARNLMEKNLLERKNGK